MNNTTHIVRSRDAAGLIRCTPHDSHADAERERRHRVTECFHHNVIIITVEPVEIELQSGPVIAWRPAVDAQPAKRPAARQEKVYA